MPVRLRGTLAEIELRRWSEPEPETELELEPVEFVDAAMAMATLRELVEHDRWILRYQLAPLLDIGGLDSPALERGDHELLERFAVALTRGLIVARVRPQAIAESHLVERPEVELAPAEQQEFEDLGSVFLQVVAEPDTLSMSACAEPEELGLAISHTALGG